MAAGSRYVAGVPAIRVGMYLQETKQAARTAARHATCSWPTTSATRQRRVAGAGWCTTSAGPTKSTGWGCRGWCGRSRMSWRPAEPVALEVGWTSPPVEGRDLGGAWVLKRLWQRLGIGQAIARVGGRPGVDAAAVERVLFALVANRALPPSWKLDACVKTTAALSKTQIHRNR